MNARQELKEVEKAMEIMRELRKSPQVQESELLERDLMKVYVQYSEQYMDLVPMVRRKPARKKAGAS